ncbi:hypothetical protein M527_16070 [Sphingobium indicum IP26]|nr:hypothetical protein M527_16070 [Sphingobium indicum IP26]
MIDVRDRIMFAMHDRRLICVKKTSQEADAALLFGDCCI